MAYTSEGAAQALDLFTDRTLYGGLSTTDGNAAGSSHTEPAGNNYGRGTILASDWPAAVPGVPSTIGPVTVSFPVPSGDWGNTAYSGIWDAASSGNLLQYGDVTPGTFNPTDADTSVEVAITLRQTLA